MSDQANGDEPEPPGGVEEDEVGAMLDRLEKEATAAREAASGTDLKALAEVGERTTVAEGALSDLAGDLGEVDDVLRGLSEWQHQRHADLRSLEGRYREQFAELDAEHESRLRALAELDVEPSSSREAEEERRAETMQAADRLRATYTTARGHSDASGAGGGAAGAESPSDAFASRLASSTAQHRQASLAAPMVQTVGDPGFEQARKELEQQLLAKYGLAEGGGGLWAGGEGGGAACSDAREEPDGAAEAGAAVAGRGMGGRGGGARSTTGAAMDGLGDLEEYEQRLSSLLARAAELDSGGGRRDRGSSSHSAADQGEGSSREGKGEEKGEG